MAAPKGLNRQIPNPLRPIRQPGYHRQCDTQRLVDTNEVVTDGVECDHVHVAAALLRNAVDEPG